MWHSYAWKKPLPAALQWQGFQRLSRTSPFWITVLVGLPARARRTKF